MKILFIGDIVGKSGRATVKELLPSLRSEHALDLVIAITTQQAIVTTATLQEVVVGTTIQPVMSVDTA